MTLLSAVFFLGIVAALVVVLWNIFPLFGLVAGGWILWLLWESRKRAYRFHEPGPINPRYETPLERDRWA
jgi:hypothetical protein